MIALDTNIIVRFLWARPDDPESRRQGLAARQLIAERRSEGMYVSPVTLAEIAWYLKSQKSTDGQKIFSRVEIHALLSDLISKTDVLIERRAPTMEALERYRTGNTDFADCLIAERGHAVGASTTFTFDRKAARSAPDRFTLLSA